MPKAPTTLIPVLLQHKHLLSNTPTKTRAKHVWFHVNTAKQNYDTHYTYKMNRRNILGEQIVI